MSRIALENSSHWRLTGAIRKLTRRQFLRENVLGAKRLRALCRAAVRQRRHVRARRGRLALRLRRRLGRRGLRRRGRGAGRLSLRRGRRLRARRRRRLGVRLPRRLGGRALRAAALGLRVRAVPQRSALRRRRRLVAVRVSAGLDGRRLLAARRRLRARLSRARHLRAAGGRPALSLPFAAGAACAAVPRPLVLCHPLSLLCLDRRSLSQKWPR